MKPWSDEEDAILRECWGFDPLQNIADRLSISVKDVMFRALLLRLNEEEGDDDEMPRQIAPWPRDMGRFEDDPRPIRNRRL